MKYLGHSTIKFNELESQSLPHALRKTTVGIDCHKSSYHVQFLHHTHTDIQKRYCKFGVAMSDMMNITLFLKACEKEFAPIELALLESSGAYSRPLFFHLAKTWPVCMVNPANFATHGKKTDKADAEKLARLAMQGTFAPSYLETPQETDIKQTARAACKHRQMAATMSNSLGAFLVQNNIGITRGNADIGIASKSGQQILQAIVDGETDPTSIAQAAQYYQGDGKAEKFAAIVDALQGALTLSPYARRVIGMKLAAMAHERAAYQQTLMQTKDMLSACDHNGLTGAEAIKLLCTIPSISERAAILILSELGLRFEQRFEDVEQMVSYCGLNPSRQYSGDKQTSTRKAVMGNPHVREVLIECGQSLMKSIHQLGERYRALQRRNGGVGNAGAYKLAVAAAAKGLCKAMYWVITKREPFSDAQYDYTRAIRNKEVRLKRLMKDMRQIQEELQQDGGATSSVLKHAIAALAKEKYILQPVVVSWDKLFEKRIRTTLEKLHIQSVADVWYFLSSDALKTQKGIGEKTYQTIINAMKQHGVIEEVSA